MAVIRAENTGEQVRTLVFGRKEEPVPAAPLALPNVTRDGEIIPEPEPEPERVVQPVAPPPAPVFEVPPEVLQSVYEQAVLQGQEEGKAQVFAELQVLQQRYAGALDQLVAVSRVLASQNQVQLITLACRVAEKLVRNQLSVNPDQLMNLIRQAILDLDEMDEVTIQCSTPDYEFINEHREELTAGEGDAFTVRVHADSSLEYGDFRVETRTGSIDGRVATQLSDVESQLREQHAATPDQADAEPEGEG